MIYPIQILSQLPLLIKGFRKERGFTQAAMAGRLGITQQSYAYFEANPATATVERLYTVLRLLDVEIGLSQTYSIEDRRQTSAGSLGVAQQPAVYGGKVIARKTKSSVSAKASHKVISTRKKESW